MTKKKNTEAEAARARLSTAGEADRPRTHRPEVVALLRRLIGTARTWTLGAQVSGRLSVALVGGEGRAFNLAGRDPRAIRQELHEGLSRVLAECHLLMDDISEAILPPATVGDGPPPPEPPAKVLDPHAKCPEVEADRA